MKKNCKRFMSLCLSILCLAVFIAPQAHAVPAFGRTIGGNCTACHATPTWQLNEMGLEFLKNGHRSEALAFKADEIKWDNYLSFVWKGRAYYTENAKPRSQFEQHSFSIYSGGALSERFSYFTEMYLSENTGVTNRTTVAGYGGDAARKKLAEAFLQYNQPLGGKNFVAVRAGEILPEMIHTFGAGARSIEDRAQIFNVATNSANPYKPFTRSQGLDVKLNAEVLEATVGVVDGAATGTNAIDTNNHKDLYAGLQGNLDQHGSAVGLFAYSGLFTTYATAEDPSSAPVFDNEFSKMLVLARFVQDKFRIVGAYMTGKEEENISSAKTETKNKGYFALVDYNFMDSLGVFARYDMLDPNKDNSYSETKLLTVGLNGLLYMHEKSAARWNLELSDKKISEASASATETKTQKILGQLTWAI
ncbi:MAG: hypothetical protein A2X86_10540 [Bdellovibrionales bacterium GWA2_49_15]|nr:MAG: hypothetical protein A2X86_10540 [Bdellovibrionales bacterium GWA2_49_15]HAZ14765.1 hypothetical protein [Bdellovibrionales bacterium]